MHKKQKINEKQYGKNVLKILILNWRDIRHPRAGGAELRLHKIYAPLTKWGHKIILYSCAFPRCKKQEKIDGIQIYRLGNDLTFSFLCILKLRYWVKKHGPDIVVEDLNKLPLYSPLFYKGPLIIQMHHLWRSSIFKETLFPLALFVWLSEKTIPWIYRKCYFSVVSESTRTELLAMDIKPQNIRVIHNGMDPLDYKPKQKQKEPFIIWISRLQKYKGPTDACNILEKLLPTFPNIKLVLVGEGPFRSKLEQIIIGRGLQNRVHLTGFISEREKIDLLQRAAIHLQSSYKEGWGLSVIEANACGCPVVANDTTGLRDSVRNGETGLLYRFCDLDDAADKVAKILTNHSFRQKLVDNGLKWAAEFSWERNSTEMLEFFKKIHYPSIKDVDGV